MAVSSERYPGLIKGRFDNDQSPGVKRSIAKAVHVVTSRLDCREAHFGSCLSLMEPEHSDIDHARPGAGKPQSIRMSTSSEPSSNGSIWRRGPVARVIVRRVLKVEVGGGKGASLDLA
jgi:hypothetical protein